MSYDLICSACGPCAVLAAGGGNGVVSAIVASSIHLQILPATATVSFAVIATRLPGVALALRAPSRWKKPIEYATWICLTALAIVGCIAVVGAGGASPVSLSNLPGFASRQAAGFPICLENREARALFASSVQF